VLANGIHGGNQLDLIATANAFQVSLFVHQLDSKSNVISCNIQSEQQSNKEIHVFFSHNHYDAIVDKRANEQQICYIGNMTQTEKNVSVLNPYDIQNVDIKQFSVNMTNGQYSYMIYNMFSYVCEPFLIHQLLHCIGTNFTSQRLPNHFTLFIPKTDSPLIHQQELHESFILEHYLILYKWNKSYIRIGKDSRIISVWNSAGHRQPFPTFHSMPPYRNCSGLYYPIWDTFTEDGWYNKQEMYNDTMLLSCVKTFNKYYDTLQSEFTTKLTLHGKFCKKCNDIKKDRRTK
jgi:galactitol-specific phosphotransferase system IIB component